MGEALLLNYMVKVFPDHEHSATIYQPAWQRHIPQNLMDQVVLRLWVGVWRKNQFSWAGERSSMFHSSSHSHICISSEWLVIYIMLCKVTLNYHETSEGGENDLGGVAICNLHYGPWVLFINSKQWRNTAFSVLPAAWILRKIVVFMHQFKQAMAYLKGHLSTRASYFQGSALYHLWFSSSSHSWL